MMKYLLCCILIFLTVRACFSGNQLNDVIRGRAWKALDTTSKAVYIKGIEDTIILIGSANSKTGIIKSYDGILSQDVERIQLSLNNFYSDNENINISAVDALLIISDYSKGMPRSKVDGLLAAFRQQALKEIQQIQIDSR